MTCLSFKKTFLLERSGDRLQFHTEGAPLFKGALLLGVVAFFLITYYSGGTSHWVRVAVVGYCLFGFLLMGNRYRVTIDREKHQVVLERSFYFLKRIQRRPFADCRELRVETARFGSRVCLVFNDDQRVTIGQSSSKEEAGIWHSAISSLIKK